MKHLLNLILSIIMPGLLIGQTTITLRPDAAVGKDAWIVSNGASTNYGTSANFAAISWTSGGAFNSRSLLGFDLSSIPANAIISNAKLSLYCNTTSDHTQLHSGTNSCYLERITSTWAENTVTWNNQPSSTSANRVTLPASTSNTQNYPDIDVTSLVTDMVNNPGTSHGFMLKLVTEATWRSLIFASSDHADSTRRPKLEITYQVQSISLIKPSSSDSLFQGFSYPITFTASGTGNINIEYSTNGSVWNAIANGIHPSTGVYYWTPTFTAASCWIRVRSTLFPQLVSTNSAPFKILSTPTLNLISPNNGGSYWSGNNLNISWNSSGINTIALEYKIGQGGQWNIIANQVQAATGSYNWTLPNVFSNQVYLRVRGISPVQISDEADSTIAIRPSPSVNLIAPNGQEVWLNNGPQLITWQSNNSFKVNLHYSINGSSWNVIADNIVNTNSYQWTLPSINSNAVKIRIQDADFPEFQDTSDNAFTIRNPPALSLSEPLMGNIYFHGDTVHIKWSAQYSTNLKIEYALDSNLSWTTIIAGHPSNSLNYKWIPANTIMSRNVKIRISDEDFNNYASTSNGTISILGKPILTITYPHQKAKWLNNTAKPILWTTSNTDRVNLYFSADKINWTLIEDSIISSLGIYNWNLPNINEDSIWFKVSNTEFSQFYDHSDIAVSIVSPPNLKLNHPSGSEVFYIGSSYEIKWQANYSNRIRIEFSPDNSSWNLIADSVVSSTGKRLWTVPNNPSFNARIRITDLEFPQYKDSNQIYFSIITKPTLTLISPNGGENLTANAQHTIIWASSNVDKVRILYTSNGSTWLTIDSMINATTGSYLWQIPNLNSLNCKIRIVNEADQSIIDESNNTFRISPLMGLNANQIETLKIYPNPALIGGQVFIDVANLGNSRVSLIDLSGKEISMGEINPTTKMAKIELPNHLSAGVYLIHLKNEQHQYYQKIILSY